MKIRIHYIIISIGVLIGCKKKPEVTAPVLAAITDAVYASGHIEAVDQFVLTSYSEGYLKTAWVEENDIVVPGQVLFTLDNARGDIEEAAAAQNLQLAISNASENSPTLQQLYAELATARQKRTNDSINYLRMKRLLETNTVAKVDVEHAELAFEDAINSVRSIIENIESIKITLKQNLINSRSHYNSSVAGNSYFQLQSTRDCKVYKVMKREGELIRKGEATALLGHPDSLVVVLSVDETGIAKVKDGQQVLVELNTHPEKIYAARVTKIYPYFEESTQSYTVEAAFDNQPSGVLAGTLLQANIITASQQQALVIPRMFLTPDERVVVKRGNHSDTVAIRTGIVSTEWVEVLGGISTQDKLVKVN